MDAQLRLIPRPKLRGAAEKPAPASLPRPTGVETEAPSHWRIDDDARARGRAGISQARQALHQARQAGRHTTAA